MKTFREWMYSEDSNGVASEITWTNKTRNEWDGELVLSDVTFHIDFRRTFNFSDQFDIGFAQKGTQKPVGMPTLISLFQALDEAILELFESNPDVKRVWIFPQAMNDRVDKLKSRGIKDIFDQSKFNAYQLLFQHSKLNSLGYTMKPSGKELYIFRPRPKKEFQWVQDIDALKDISRARFS